jgi:hypothetical protein
MKAKVQYCDATWSPRASAAGPLASASAVFTRAVAMATSWYLNSLLNTSTSLVLKVQVIKFKDHLKKSKY